MPAKRSRRKKLGAQQPAYNTHRWPEEDLEKVKQSVHSLVDNLFDLESETRQGRGKKSAKWKTQRALQAMEFIGHLREILAGWAIDHIVGVAASSVSATGDDEINSHEHEKEASRYDFSDIMVNRRILARLIEAERMPQFPDLQVQLKALAQGLEALNVGETQTLMKRQERRKGVIHNRRLGALCHVEFRAASGEKKGQATERVAEAFGCTGDRLNNWRHRDIPRTLGQDYVSLALVIARKAGTAAKDGPADARCFYRREIEAYSDIALERDGRAYRAALRKYKDKMR